MNYLTKKILIDLEDGLSKKDVQYFINGKPYSISKQELEKGVIIVQPVSTDIMPLTTGITDEENKTVAIILAKSIQDQFVKNAQYESGSAYLTRVFEGKDQSNQLQANTIRYIVRKNLRLWGLGQSNITIEYDDDALDYIAEGIVTGTMTLTVDDHFTQPIL